MKWSRFSVTCPSAAVEAVVGLFMEVMSGGPSVEECGDARLVRAYAPEGAPADALVAELQTALLAVPPYLTGGATLQVQTDLVADEDWESAWKDFYHPVRIGRRLVIKPTWEAWPPADDPAAARPEDLVIELDPEMAFGTGSHPSTQLCLCVLEDLTAPGDAVLDVGCGSGILSLAAALLGATRVLALDADPVAVEVAEANVARNEAGERVEVRRADALEGLQGQYRLIVANINAPVGCRLAPAAFDRLTPGGYYVASGLVESAVEMVRRAQQEAGFDVVDVRRQEGWACVIGRRP